jgi:flavin reductase (DIM6/NTAB) family NADH-FMN oxidoreductase RutF
LKKIDTSLVHRLFYPAVPALLCASAGKRVSAMPVVSYLSISSSPPIIGVACFKGNFTMRLAIDSGEFSLCLVDRTMIVPMSFLATQSGRRFADKLEAAGLKHRPGRTVRAPVISGSVAVLECSVSSCKRLGDHSLLIGKVEAAYATKDFREYWRFKEYSPILYTGWRKGLRTYGRR